MREIKFRGLSKYNRGWVYGDLVHIHDSEGRAVAIKDTLYHVNDGRINLIPTVIIEGTEGQYTGKNDKNGVELYEGEIVRVKSSLNSALNQNGVIEWESDHKCRFYINCGVWVPDIGDATLVLEIIGNVHENPSLLDADARGESHD